MDGVDGQAVLALHASLVYAPQHILKSKLECDNSATFMQDKTANGRYAVRISQIQQQRERPIRVIG